MNRIRIIAICATLFILLGTGWYISYLRNSLNEMETERDQFKKAAETSINYIRRYEAEKQINDNKTQELLSMVDAMPEDKCPVPDSVRSIIGKL